MMPFYGGYSMQGQLPSLYGGGRRYAQGGYMPQQQMNGGGYGWGNAGGSGNPYGGNSWGNYNFGGGMGYGMGMPWQQTKAAPQQQGPGMLGSMYSQGSQTAMKPVQQSLPGFNQLAQAQAQRTAQGPGDWYKTSGVNYGQGNSSYDPGMAAVIAAKNGGYGSQAYQSILGQAGQNGMNSLLTKYGPGGSGYDFNAWNASPTRGNAGTPGAMNNNMG